MIWPVWLIRYSRSFYVISVFRALDSLRCFGVGRDCKQALVVVECDGMDGVFRSMVLRMRSVRTLSRLFGGDANYIKPVKPLYGRFAAFSVNSAGDWSLNRPL